MKPIFHNDNEPHLKWSKHPQKLRICSVEYPKTHKWHQLDSLCQRSDDSRQVGYVVLGFLPWALPNILHSNAGRGSPADDLKP